MCVSSVGIGESRVFLAVYTLTRLLSHPFEVIRGFQWCTTAQCGRSLRFPTSPLPYHASSPTTTNVSLIFLLPLCLTYTSLTNYRTLTLRLLCTGVIILLRLFYNFSRSFQALTFEALTIRGNATITKQKNRFSSTHVRKPRVFKHLKRAGSFCFFYRRKKIVTRKKNFESSASNGEYCQSGNGVSIRCSSDGLENSHVQLALGTSKHAVFLPGLKKI